MEVNVFGGTISEEEKQAYIDHVKAKTKNADIVRIDIKINGEFADLEWHYSPIPFDRVRRITGYLVGTLDRFNNGKRAEEHDRVKHSLDYDDRKYSGLID